MTTVQNLRDAEAAYHKLVTGTMARVIVDQNGERVEYTATNAARLQQYIVQLKRELKQSSAGPMRVWF